MIHKVALQDYDVCCLPGPGVVDGIAGDVILLTPPYNITKEEIELAVDRVAKAVRQVLG